MIITQTPLRISFLGGNTDFREFFTKHGGCVLTTAINKYVYCIITKRFDEKIYVNWSKKEIVDEISQIKHELVREALKKVGIKNGVEITFLSDIPAEGSGLGSSSSVTVGVLNALYHYVGQNPSAKQLAREAAEIEIDILKKPIGIQDQYIAAYGGLRFFQFQKNGKVTNEKITLNNGFIKDLENSLMLFYTGRTRKAGTILQNLRTNISQKTALLLKTKNLAILGEKAVKKGQILALGKLLNEYWSIKKQMASGVSDGEIDKIYQKAMKAGAVGGKIAGAGGGGFLLLMVSLEKRHAVRQVLKDLQEMPIRLEPDGSKVILNISQY